MFDLDEIKARAKAKGQTRVELDIPLPRRFDVSQTTTQSAWMDGRHRDKLYVWFHVDDEGEPFYAGLGRGATAWERHGGVAWEWFVRERLGGSYRVAVLAVGLDDSQSADLLEQVLEVYALFLLNQSNIYRGVDMEALERHHEIRARIKPFYDLIRNSKDPTERSDFALQAQTILNNAKPEQTEKGKFDEVLLAMGAMQPMTSFFMPYIVEELMATGNVQGARAALDDFKARAPSLIDSPKIQRLQRMIDRGSFKRRKKASV